MFACFMAVSTSACYFAMYTVLNSEPSLSANKGNLLDFKMLWTRTAAESLFTSLSPDALATLKLFYVIDLVFPFLYAPLLSTLIALFLNIVPHEGLPAGATPPLARRVIAGLPLGAAFFDLIENSIILFLLNHYNKHTSLPRPVTMIGGIATMLKWAFFLLPLIVFWCEIISSPREDENCFDELLQKTDGRRDQRGKKKSSGKEE